jgi:hypothetical protein
LITDKDFIFFGFYKKRGPGITVEAEFTTRTGGGG